MRCQYNMSVSGSNRKTKSNTAGGTAWSAHLATFTSLVFEILCSHNAASRPVGSVMFLLHEESAFCRNLVGIILTVVVESSPGRRTLA